MGWKNAVAAVSGVISDFFIPRTCLCCKKDQRYDYSPPLCVSCLEKLRVIEFPYCDHCGAALPSGGRLCYGCRHEKKKRSFVFSRSAVMFGPEIREVIHAYKYHGYRKLSLWLGGIMTVRMREYPEFLDYGLVVPVPVSAKKESQRGFNQSGLLAGVLAGGTGKRICGDSLFKSRETGAQAGLNREEREKNVSGSFACRGREKIRGERIILVDDVATTLSTLNEASDALMEAGASAVACYTLARE